MEAATPWSTVEAEAVKGGSSTESTPAQPEGGEGEAKVRSPSFFRLCGGEGVRLRGEGDGL